MKINRLFKDKKKPPVEGFSAKIKILLLTEKPTNRGRIFSRVFPSWAQGKWKIHWKPRV